MIYNIQHNENSSSFKKNLPSNMQYYKFLLKKNKKNLQL